VVALCVEYIALVKNHTARSTLGNRTPIEKHTGQTPDVSKLLQYQWWEPVYFLDDEGLETLGRWAGVAEHVGDELTFIVVSNETSHALFHSDLQTAADPNAPNFRAETNNVDKMFTSSSKDKDPRSTSVFSPISTDTQDPLEKVYPYLPED
jgi:hypothetical protein